MSLEGIDVSSHNPTIDWAAAAAGGVAFAFVKLTEGVGYVNPLHAAQAAGARAAGVAVGHYHYARPDESKPEDEAAYFLGALGAHTAGEPVALDLEVAAPGVDVGAWALAWLGRVEAALGMRPLIYTYPNYAADNLAASGLGAYPLWWASYDAAMAPVPPQWGAPAIWQYAGDAAGVPGCGEPTDRDRFAGTLDDWRALGTPLAAATPPPYGPYNVPLGGGFLKTYNDAGAAALGLYGWPITGELTEGGLTVQYFERARFEYHQDTHAITFGLVGLELAKARGYVK